MNFTLRLLLSLMVASLCIGCGDGHDDEDGLANGISSSGPVVMTYVLTPTLSVRTTVVGDSRTTAVVAIYDGYTAIYSATLTPSSPTVSRPGALPTSSGITIDLESLGFNAVPDGMSFVTMRAEISRDGTTTPFIAQIAAWTTSP